MKGLLKLLLVYVAFLGFMNTTSAQSFYFGPKIGPMIGFQKWNGFERNVLLKYHAAFFVESYSEEGKGTLFAQLGYHKRGSAERGRVISLGTGNLSNTRRTFEFNNISVLFGAKQFLKKDVKNKPYYHFGLRGEYTLNTNLEQYIIYNGWFPVDPYVNKINYGVTAGGGMEFFITDLISGFVEFSFSPDISKQYFQPALQNVADPFIAGQSRNLSQQEIRNISFELSVGMKFLRKVEYGRSIR